MFLKRTIALNFLLNIRKEIWYYVKLIGKKGSNNYQHLSIKN